MGMFESTASLLQRVEGANQGMPYPVDPGSQAHLDAQDKALNTILKHEGGYQNNKADAANKNSKGQWVGTNKGITPQAYEEFYGEVPTQRDMMKLSKDKAKAIYTENYIRPVVDNLGIKPTSPLFNQVLDITVNHGYSGAVALIQRAAGTQVDGKSGPATTEAINSLSPEVLNNRLVEARKVEYERQIRSQPEKSAFAKGWDKRAESFRVEETEDGGVRPEPNPVAGEGVERPRPLQGDSSRTTLR